VYILEKKLKDGEIKGWCRNCNKPEDISAFGLRIDSERSQTSNIQVKLHFDATKNIFLTVSNRRIVTNAF